MKRFSIIIPVYNAENTLERAIYSVINQTFTDWELLIVDDASTDGSFKIAESIAQYESKIKLLRLPQNSGNAKLPRDFGVMNSIGEYCMFLDSDDEIVDDYLQIMENRIQKYDADVILPIIIKKDENTSAIISSYNEWITSDQVLTGKEACSFTIPSWKIGTGGISFKRDLYQNDFEQNAYYYMYSDEITERLILYYAKSVVGSTAQYIYWQHPSSITHKKSAKLYDMLLIDRQLLDFTLEHYDSDFSIKQFQAMLSHLIVLQKDAYRYASAYSLDDKKKIRLILVESWEYLRYITGIRKSFKEKILLVCPIAFRLFCRVKR